MLELTKRNDYRKWFPEPTMREIRGSLENWPSVVVLWDSNNKISFFCAKLPKVCGLYSNPEENFTAQSLLLYGYGAIKELNESSHFSLVVVFFGLKHFSFVSLKIP